MTEFPQKEFDELFERMDAMFKKAFDGRQVAYGSVPLVRRPQFAWLRGLKTPAMLLAIFVLFPLLVATSWMLFPLWFVPLHEWGWGPVDIHAIAFGCGMLHGLGGAAAWVIMGLITIVSRIEDGRWWWDPAEKS